MPTWIEALKKWNASRSGAWCVPKKGTKDYDAVKRLMKVKGEGKMKGGVKSLKELSADAAQKRLEQLVEINPTTAPRLYGITPGALRKQIADIRNTLRLLGITPRA